MSVLIRFLVIGYLFIIPSVANAGHLNGDPPPPNGYSVPELDASASAAAFSLLLGGVMILSGRRRRQG